MATENKQHGRDTASATTDSQRNKAEPPETGKPGGSKGQRGSSNDLDEASAGGPPLDPADKDMIESNRDKPR